MPQITLIKNGSQLGFPNETSLEDFIYDNLHALFNLNPISRQYRTYDGQICDILAVSSQQELVILELKNTEDRYVVQQLTRYYDALIKEKPFLDKINYDHPVRLIAVAPNFHRDNLIDRKYNVLNIDLYSFSIQSIEDQHYFEIFNDNFKKSISIDYQEKTTDQTLPELPRFLDIAINNHENSEIIRPKLLKIREFLLTYLPHIQEFTDNPWVSYGNKKNNVFLEIYCKKSGLTSEYPLFFLKVPDKGKYSRDKNRRMRSVFMLDKNWEDVICIKHVPSGIKRSKRDFPTGTLLDQYSFQHKRKIASIPKDLHKINDFVNIENPIFEMFLAITILAWEKSL